MRTSSRLLWLVGLLGSSQLQCVLAQSKYINAGGGDYNDGTNVWEDDAPYYNSGSPYSTSSLISGTTLDPMYQVERWGAGLMYTIPLASGSYDISLHFAEIYLTGPNQRIFDVKLEGTTVFAGLDVYSEAGNAANTALVKTVTNFPVNDGSLDIDFVRREQNPKIQGIQIVPSSGAPPPPPPPPPPPSGFAKFINAGGGDYNDGTNVWEDDAPYYNSGSPYSTSSPISGTTLDPMYQVERWGAGLMYTIPLASGSYDISLHFAEIYLTGPNSRVFDVKLEGITVFAGLDVYTEAGNAANTALVKTVTNFPVNDGFLDIDFVRDKQNPKIQGIEIRSSSGGPPPAPTPPPPTPPPPTPTPPTPPPPPGSYSKYINAGGGDYNDGTNVWEDDTGYYNLGSPYSTGTAISDTTKDPLYQVERYGAGIMYTIPGIPSGTYDIHLHFAEIYFTSQPGQRVFDVTLEGTTVFAGLDIYVEAGNTAFKAVVKSVLNFPITDGTLEIGFKVGQQNPKIQGIEIVQASGPQPSPTPQPPQPTPAPVSVPSGAQWIDLNENQNYIGRHECSFVQAGRKFYLFGGRESPRRLDAYDYASDTWSTSAPAPEDFNHFQAIEYEGLIWVIGAYKTNSFPNEAVAEKVYVYDPANDEWMEGPSIPASRRRGGGGLQVYNGKFYLVAGNTNGHSGGFVDWFDEYDPRTGQWRQLPNALRPRDHFHAVVIGTRLYAAGGRRTELDNTFGLVVPEVDVYDFTTGAWLTSNRPDNLPEPRAAAATAAFDGKVLLAGGESLASGDALDVVHTLDPSTGNWQQVDSLNFGRHGTQAIVSGQGVYVTAGSPNRGGGNQRNMEVFNQDAPAGIASVAGLLSAPAIVDVTAGTPATVTLQQSGGNQGIFVESITISGPDSSDFAIISGFPSALLIGNGETHNVRIQYSGSENDAEAQVTVLYSGDQVLIVTLNGKLSGQPPAPTPSPPSTSPLDIVDFVIVDAITDDDISSVDSCNGCITTSTAMNIRAVPRGAVGSIRLTLSGPESTNTLENVAPYALYGDNGGDYNEKTLISGTYTVRAQAFSLSGGSGTQGTEASATFSV